ncbi:MAG: hypothetical protein MJB14_08725 [Spirochaetes bacterium]|nr:hypothetical protein [Spirochaetota bacterium]
MKHYRKNRYEIQNINPPRKIVQNKDVADIYDVNKRIIVSGIIGMQTKTQLESSICFARYLNTVGMNRKNYKLFLKIIETNNMWVVDAIIGRHHPHLFFSSIKPNSYLIKRAFQLLTAWHPGQIYEKVLLAILGIIEYSYYKADDGYEILPLEINHLNNIGKFLVKEKDQDYKINDIILRILDRISSIGEYKKTLKKSVIAKHSFDIRIAYFDNTKNLKDHIPDILLVRYKREDYNLDPSPEFIQFFNQIEGKT